MAHKTEEKQSVTRRLPRQERALAKVELMFEAALRILETEDLAAFTTNRIAAVAGVSIGTLYQYFPDKDALLLALVKREVESTFARLDELKEDTKIEPGAQAAAVSAAGVLDDRIRSAVRIMINVFDGRLNARKRLMMALARIGQAHLLDEEILQHGLAFMGSSEVVSGSLTPTLSKLDFVHGFVMTRAVSGTLRAALLHDALLLQNPAFEDALVALIRGYLDQFTNTTGA